MLAVEPDRQLRAGLGIEHQPAFFFPILAGKRSGVARVHLHRELFAGEKVFDEELRQFGRGIEPDLSDALAAGRKKGFR